MTELEEVIQFFANQEIPMLPCYGLKDGVCECKKGRNCPSPGKHPLMFNWQAAATCDPVKVKAWFSSNKPINLAIATGRKNSNGKHLLAVDADAVNHPFLKLLKDQGTTVTQRSGSGGEHALYWSDKPIKNSCQLVDEKLDIRGVGGILIVAPSSHKSGKKYEFTCNLKETAVRPIPEILREKLETAVFAKRKAVKKSPEPKVEKRERQNLFQGWSSREISEIKDSLLIKNEVVPCGIRNTTMHRILSSYRAKGADRTSLETIALQYVKQFENANSFLDEVILIVDSVLKYQPYNNSHEQVNQIYINWLKKRKIESDCSLEVLNSLDEEFFSLIQPERSGDSVLVSLKEISELRSFFFYSRGYQRFSTYKSQLLAKKLLGIGVKKKRTSKNNLWEVSKRIFSLAKRPEPTYINKKEQRVSEQNKVKDGDVITKDGKKLRVEVLTRSIPKTEHSKEHLFAGKAGYDYNMSFIRYLSKLTEEQRGRLEERSIILDDEATSTLIQSMIPGDIIGFRFSTYRVVSNSESGLEIVPVSKIYAKDKVGQYEETSTAESEFPSKGEIDFYRELGFCQILWRNGIPFGEEATKNINVVLFHPLDNETNTDSSQPV